MIVMVVVSGKLWLVVLLVLLLCWCWCKYLLVWYVLITHYCTFFSSCSLLIRLRRLYSLPLFSFFFRPLFCLFVLSFWCGLFYRLLVPGTLASDLLYLDSIPTILFLFFNLNGLCRHLLYLSRTNNQGHWAVLRFDVWRFDVWRRENSTHTLMVCCCCFLR